MPLLPFLVALLPSPLATPTADWPQWRGPHLDGTADARDLPTEWSAERNVRWRTALPGWSGATPIVVGENVFVVTPTAAEAEELARYEEERSKREAEGGGRRRGGGRHPGGPTLELWCLARADGAVRWRAVLDARGNALHMKGNDASPSPVSDGAHVWTLSGNGQVACFTVDGERAWERNLQDDYGPFGLNWGYGSSPLLHAGRLVIQVLHGTHTDAPSYLVALDGATGETAWRVERPTDAPRESPDAYTTPALLRAGDETHLVVTGGDVVTGHDPADGRELWRVGGLNPRSAPNYRIVASPVVAGDLVFAPTRVKPLLAIRVGEDRRPKDDAVAWRYEDRGAPDVPTPTCDGERLYLVDDGGIAACVEASSGKLVWGPERTVSGGVSASPLLADGKLFVTSEEGVTVVLAAGPEFRMLATNELDGSYTLSSPIAVDDALFVRTGEALYCIGK